MSDCGTQRSNAAVSYRAIRSGPVDGQAPGEATFAAISRINGAAARKLDPMRREYFRGLFRISRKESLLTGSGDVFDVRRLSEDEALARARHSRRPARG